MITELSNYIADYFSRHEIIEDDWKIIYQVGIDVIISTAIQISTIVGIGALIGNLAGALGYLLCFMSVRAYCGGFHAKTRTGCLLVMIAGYLVSSLGVKWLTLISGVNLAVLLVIISLFDFAVFMRYVPIKNNTKVLEKNWRANYRNKAFRMLLFWKVISVGMMYYFSDLSIQLFATELVITVLILACLPWRDLLEQGMNVHP